MVTFVLFIRIIGTYVTHLLFICQLYNLAVNRISYSSPYAIPLTLMDSYITKHLSAEKNERKKEEIFEEIKMQTEKNWFNVKQYDKYMHEFVYKCIV